MTNIAPGFYKSRTSDLIAQVVKCDSEQVWYMIPQFSTLQPCRIDIFMDSMLPDPLIPAIFDPKFALLDGE